MKPSELLKQKGWCQGFYATDKHGHRVSWANGDAYAFCTIGAVFKCYGDDEDGYDILETLKNYLDVFYISVWNDTPGRTKEEVIAALEAIGE